MLDLNCMLIYTYIYEYDKKLFWNTLNILKDNFLHISLEVLALERLSEEKILQFLKSTSNENIREKLYA